MKIDSLCSPLVQAWLVRVDHVGWLTCRHSSLHQSTIPRSQPGQIPSQLPKQTGLATVPSLKHQREVVQWPFGYGYIFQVYGTSTFCSRPSLPPL